MRVTIQNPGNISRLEPSATAGDKYLIFPKDQIRCPEKKVFQTGSHMSMVQPQFLKHCGHLHIDLPAPLPQLARRSQ